VTTAAGLILSLGYYLAVQLLGHWDSDMEVQVLELDLPGLGSVSLWMEYGILIITPIVLVIFLIANALGKEVHTEEAEEVAS